jgi:hypothetical protein
MRVQPEFEQGSKQVPPKAGDSPGCLLLLVLTVGGYFALSAINRAMAGSGSPLDKSICYGLLACLVILFALSPYFSKQEKKKYLAARQAWVRSSVAVEVSILDRRHFPGSSWEDGYEIPHHSSPSYHLDLETSPDQKAAHPNLTQVSVEVQEPVYTRLQDRRTVRIYYKPEAPFTFLLEEEIE